jgi:hypothetical protein
LIVSQEETYGEHSETIGEIRHSPLHQHPLPLPPLPVSLPQQLTSCEYTPLLTLPAPDLEVYDNLLPRLPAQHHAQEQSPKLKLIPSVRDSTARTPPSHPPRTIPIPQRSNKPTTEDSDSIADDPYLAFSMDIESLDISKLTLEQLDQIDPRQAQIWMLLKMHQMIRKVEDVYESAEQLYSIRQAPPPIPKKPNTQEEKQFRSQIYENILQCVKRPVPTPRQNVARNQSEQGDPNPSTTQEISINTSEAMQQESESVKDTVTPQKKYRQQKIIGKLLFNF